MAILSAASLVMLAAQSTGKSTDSQQQRILQALNRLTWGPEPGEMAAVQKMGLKHWIDDQLHPDRIPESPVLTADLLPLSSLTMTPAQVIAHYPPPEAIRQMAAGRRPFPADAQ
ncbi:MAG: DUF1800 family protein, partial [Gammaproteobacteria bacterium]